MDNSIDFLYSETMRWICGKASTDLSLFYAPGFCALFLTYWLMPGFSPFFQLMLGVMYMVDSGHSYSTVWRTYFRKGEITHDRRYWIVPPLVLGASAIWAYSGLPYLWSAIVYTTLFHYVRQNYGILRWYEKLNARSDRQAHYFLYALFSLPLVAAHFRPGTLSGHFSKFDYIVYPDATLYRWVLLIFATLFVLWIAYEIRTRLAIGRFEWNRILAIGLPSLFNAGCLLTISDPAKGVGPIVLAHGVAYLGLMTRAMPRLYPNRILTLGTAFVVILLTVALTAGAESWFEDNWVITDYMHTPGFGFKESLFVALLITPSMCHYIFDGWLWTSKHRDSKLIYG